MKNNKFKVNEKVFWVTDHALYSSPTEPYAAKPVPPKIQSGIVDSLPSEEGNDEITLARVFGCERRISWTSEKNIGRTPEEAVEKYWKRIDKENEEKARKEKAERKKAVLSLQKQAKRIKKSL